MAATRITEKANGVLSAVKGVAKPDTFGFNDLSQQIVGSFLFSAPFSVTEEVWNLAHSLTPIRMLTLIFFTVLVATLIIYYTKFQNVARENINLFIQVPKRLVSLFVVSYSATFLILWMFGVIGHITEPLWIVQLVVFVGFFASVGAAAVDIIK
jgi:uncharacterized membrane protein